MQPLAGTFAQVLNRNGQARKLKELTPEERRTWLSENARILAAEGCAECGKPLPEEAVREHLCCRCQDSGMVRTVVTTLVGVEARELPGWGKVTPCICRLTGIPEKEFLRRSGIPETMRDYSLATWGDSKARDAAERFVETWPPKPHMLFLTGTVGSGKSGLGVGVLRELWLRWHKVGRFVVAPELIRRFQASFAEEATESKEDIHREMTLAPLLVLDDYGTEYGTEFAQAEMFRLINDRHSNGRPAIVTTNLDVMSLSPRIRDRLTDAERSVWLQFTGTSRRQGR